MKFKGFKERFQKLKLYLEAGRYNQWIKNLIVFTAPIFTGHLLEMDTFLKTTFAFIVMCALSSASYMLNDIIDVKFDQVHPIKKLRPIASGRLKIQEVSFTVFLLAATSLIFSLFVSIAFFLVSLTFLLLHLLYSLYLKKLPLYDIFSISFSFVLRALSGEAITGYHIPIWLLLTIFFISLFMATVKRHAELVKVGSKARPALSLYPEHLLYFLSTTFATTTIISYSFYTYFEKPPIVNSPITAFFSTLLPSFEIRRWMMITIPFVVFGIARYAQLLYAKEEGEMPEKLIVTDKPLIFTILAWGITVIFLIYVL